MQSLHDVLRHVGFLSMVLAALGCSRSPRAQTKTCAETKDNPASAGTTDVEPITPVLYFPRLVNTGSQLTGIAAANPGQSTARVTFTAYDNSGLLLGQKDATREQLSNPSTRLMLPRTQIAELGFQIFGDSLNTTGSWAKLISNQRGMTGFYLAFDNGLNTMDGADASGRLLREFVIGELENAEISLVNPAENRQADVTLTLQMCGTLSATVLMRLNG